MPHYKLCVSHIYFLFNPPSTTATYTLSLHDALPISGSTCVAASTYSLTQHAFRCASRGTTKVKGAAEPCAVYELDRKSTRLNSSHRCISYAVFCLKKKNIKYKGRTQR